MIKSSFFRQKAIENYHNILVPRKMPKFISPLTIFLYWILFLLFIGITFAVWSYNTRLFEQGSGIIRHVAENSLSSYGLIGNKQQAQTIAILLLPGQLRTQLHTGTTTQLQIEGMHSPIVGTIERIDATLLTPEEASQQYHLSNQVVANIPNPTFVILVDLGTTIGSANYEGKHATARFPLEIPNVFSLFFTSQTLIGNGR